MPEIWEHPPSTLKSVNCGALGVLMEVLERPLSTTKNIDGGPLWRVLTEIQERPPSMLKNIDGGPLVGADRDLGVPTINIKKHR
jgi:hypothetical protein